MSVAAGAARMRSVTVRVLDAGTITSPADANGTITAPTGGANTGGVFSALGGPEITRSSRPSLPATSVTIALPAAPVVIAKVASVEPAGITTGPAIDATLGSLLVITELGVRRRGRREDAQRHGARARRRHDHVAGGRERQDHERPPAAPPPAACSPHSACR